MRLNSPRLTVMPRKSLKLLYFIPSASSQTSTTAEATVSIANTGYRSMSGLRIEGAQISVENDNKAATPYSIDSVVLRDPLEKNIIDREGIIGALPEIPSGRSLEMTVSVNMLEKGKLRSLSLTPSIDGGHLKLEDSRSFSVLTKPSTDDPSGGMLVSPIGLPAPVFYYTPKDSKLQNLAGLKLIQSRWDSSTTDGKEFIRVQTAMQSNESPDFASTLWGRVELPKIPANYRLLRVREVGAGVGPSGRGVGGDKWIETRDGKQFVNWIDTGALPRGGSINYEFIFGDPKDFEQPIFAQDLYRIQVLPEFWPQPGTVVGEIRATSPIDRPMTYSLYSRNGDTTWAVNPNTGQIVLTTPLRRGEESCLTLVVKDADGRQSVVPVAVNTGTAALQCTAITDFDHLTPLIWNPSAPDTSPTLPVTRTTPRASVTALTTADATAATPPAIFTASPRPTTMNPAWTWMTETTVPSMTPDRPLTTVPTVIVTVPTFTFGTTTQPATTTDESFSRATIPTDGWEQPSTITGTTRDSQETSEPGSESSTPETVHTHSPDTSLEPFTTIVIPWVTGSPTPLWTSTEFPLPVTTDGYVEYTTEPATEVTHVVTPLPTLEPMSTEPTMDTTLASSTPTFNPTTESDLTTEPGSTHSIEPDSTLSTEAGWNTATPGPTYSIHPDSTPTSVTDWATESSWSTTTIGPTYSMHPDSTLSTVGLTTTSPGPTHSVHPDSTLSTLPGWTTGLTGITSEATVTPGDQTTEPGPTYSVFPDSTLPSATPITHTSTEEPTSVETTPSPGPGEDHSTRGLAVEACRLKGTAPIWGVICDLSKTVKSV
ncbi:hypothetical protein PFISCL1PPCAC_45 [Pristionchus fissidentatus]|uniref:Cadherin domain-containing protein n=1 Tax=Pristionchus fissidentatus TaxID=1538716 RepID=A0AAV5UPY8_9BILA|nr:hypothetical protein PFISCL1PPCAC_45 [Pristionchus fissidentatus]